MKTKSVFRLGHLWLFLLICFLPKSVYGQFSNITINKYGLKTDQNAGEDTRSYLTPIYRKVLQTSNGIIFLQNSVSIVVDNGEKLLEIYTNDVAIIKDISLNSEDVLYALLENNVGKFVQTGNGFDFVPIFEWPIDDVFISFSIFNDSIFIVGEKSIYQLIDQSLQEVKNISSLHFLVQSKTKLFDVNSNKGIYDLIEGLAIINFDEPYKVTEMLPIGEDFITAGVQPGLLYWNTNNLQPHVLNASIAGITYLTSFGHDWIAVGTEDDGLYLLSITGEILKHLTKENGLPSNRVNRIFEDAEKGLWLTTNNGVIRIDYLNAVTQLFDGTDYGTILSMEWFNNKFYFGTTEGLFTGNNRDPDYEKIADIDGLVYDIKKIGNKLFVGASKGLYSLDKNSRLIQHGFVRSRDLYFNSKDSILYCAQKEGIAAYRFHDSKIKYLGLIPGVNDDIRSIGFDNKLNVLIAAARSPTVYFIKGNIENSSITKFDSLNGLQKNVQVFTEKNSALFGSEYGILKFDPNKSNFTHDSTFGSHFVTNNEAYRFIRDNNNDVWISSSGLVEHMVFLNGSYLRDTISLNGLPISTYRTLAIDKNKRVMMGGDDGLFRYDPGLKKIRPANFTTVISDIILKNDSIHYMGISDAFISSDLPHTLNDFTFHYAAASFDHSIDIKYSFTLTGYDDQWSDWTDKTYKEYTNLSPR